MYETNWIPVILSNAFTKLLKQSEGAVWTRLFYALVTISTLGCAIAFGIWPETRAALIDEDRLIESATVGLYLVAVLLAGVALIKFKGHRLYLCLIFVGAMICILEELSYGERILGFVAPRWFDVKIDAGHDLLFLALKLAKDSVSESPLMLAIPLFGLIALAGILFFMRSQLQQTLQWLSQAPGIRFLFGFIALGLTALVIDLIAVPLEDSAPAIHDWLQLAEELLEAIAALALTIATLCSFPAGDQRRSTGA